MSATQEKSFLKPLFALAVPFMLQSLITYAVGLADNVMIGSLGDSAVSGVYMGNQIQTVLQILCTGIEMTLLLLCSQYWGKKDTSSIHKIISVGVRFSFVLGLFFTVICATFPRQVIRLFTPEPDVIAAGTEYLSVVSFSFFFFFLTQVLIASMRSVENARIGLVVSFCSLCIDVGLNYLLIFGKFGFPQLGVRGAAIATLIARVTETAIIATYVRWIDRKLHLRFSEFLKIDKPILHDFVRYGLPIVAGQLVWGCNLLGNGIILGHFPKAVITAASLANTVNSLMYVAMNGISAAVGILVGKSVGAGDVERVRTYAKKSQILFVVLGLLTSLSFRLIRDPFLSLYDISEEAVFYGRQFIGILCFTCIGTCYQCGSLSGLVKSGGDVRFVFHNDTIFVFLVVLPSAILATLLGCEPWIVFLCLKSDQILKCIPAFFKIRKFDWVKNLTEKKKTEN